MEQLLNSIVEFMGATAVPLLIVAPLAQGAVLLLMARAHRHGRSIAFTERLTAALTLTISSVLVSLVALNKALAWGVHPDLILIGLTTALAINVVPAMIWLWLYMTSRF